jgi:MFS transporter, DHA1 family, inner membrane transport protein
LLVATLFLSASQFVIFPYLGVLISKLTGASVVTVSVLPSIYGLTGVFGNAVAVQLVKVTGPPLARTILLASMTLGSPFWIFGSPVVGVLAVAIALWGFGFAAANAMQQAQSVRIAPSLSTPTIALNASAIYLGQAAGALVGAELLADGFAEGLGYGVAAFLVAALLVTELPRRRPTESVGKS